MSCHRLRPYPRDESSWRCLCGGIRFEATYPHPDEEQIALKLYEREIEERRPRDVGGFFREVPGASVIKKGGMALDPVIRGSKYDQLNVIIDGGVRVFGACPNRMDPSTAHVSRRIWRRSSCSKGPTPCDMAPRSAVS